MIPVIVSLLTKTAVYDNINNTLWVCGTAREGAVRLGRVRYG